MDLHFTEEQQAFAAEVRAWLEEALGGEFAGIRGRGGPGDEHGMVDERRAWEKALGAAGWIGIGWPEAVGGRGLDLWHQVVFAEEYARAGGPGRLGHMGEQLVGPTLLGFGSEAQQRRFLPPILRGEELWCQGFSEPDAGSDLAGLSTRAVLEGDEWVLSGQKVWTSLAHLADWCFVLARTDADAPRHRGLSFLLVPMDQPGIEVRPIRQLTGDAEFNEVFFDGARTSAENVVGGPGEGWKVAMGTLAVERGVSTLGQQLGFGNELELIKEAATRSGRLADPAFRDRLVDLDMRLRIMRMNSVRALTVADTDPQAPVAMVGKLYWATLHRDMGEAAVDALGARGMLGADAAQPNGSVDGAQPNGSADDVDEQRLRLLFEFSRSDTIYGGTNQVQRNIIAERVLGLPRQPQ
jgi:alkylation response protein AidB-like acyl-CoA dehydrogenase